MNNKVHSVPEKPTTLILVKPTTSNKIEPNLIAAVAPNQEPQEEKKPIAFLLHHSNTIFIDLLKRHLKKEQIEVQKEININKDALTYEKAMQELEKYLKIYVPKPGDIFGIEANLGSPGSNVPSCFPAIDQVLQKNPKAIIFIFTNTPDCVTATLKKYQGQQVYYIGTQTFDTTDDIINQIVVGRTFTNASKFYEFYKKSQVPGSSPTSSTLNNSGLVLSIASSPKSQVKNSIPEGCSNKQNFLGRIASCFSWKSKKSNRNKSGRNNESSTAAMENSFMDVRGANHTEEQPTPTHKGKKP